MRFELTPEALEQMAGFFGDQPGMHAMNAAIRALTRDPEPPGGEHHGTYHRLKAGQYRIVYDIAGDLITIRRVDKVPGP